MRQSQRARNVPNHLREYQLSEESLAAIEYSASQGNATLSQIQRNRNDWDQVMPDNEEDRIPDLDEDSENETDEDDDDVEEDESEAEESDEEESEEQRTFINYSDACHREPDTCNNGTTPFNLKECYVNVCRVENFVNRSVTEPETDESCTNTPLDSSPRNLIVTNNDEEVRTESEAGSNDLIIVDPLLNDHAENLVCLLCQEQITKRQHFLKCSTCQNLFHQRCIKMSATSYRDMKSSNQWVCHICQPRNELSDLQKKMKWGDIIGINKIQELLETMYGKIVKWAKNIFEVPRGPAGKEFILEATKIIHLFDENSIWEPIALHQLLIFFPLMLQKPSAKSKAKNHTRYLAKRLKMGKEGRLSELMSEAEEIQKRLCRSIRKKEQAEKGFIRLMLLGKVKQALKVIDANSEISGVHELTEMVRKTLEEKHPKGESADPDVLIEGIPPHVEEVIFEGINGGLIQEAAKNTSGSGGPTKVDSDVWKHILCSKAFSKEGKGLADEIACLARKMCTKDIPNKYLSSLEACRLIPLIKEITGVRPIGIGEVLRRIIGKSVSKILRNDILQASGTLQTFSVLESGVEAAIH